MSYLKYLFFYRNYHGYITAWKWHTLVHVCRRWRQIIFASPNRLDLRILCTHRTPVRKSLDIWPPFPIAVDYGYHWISIQVAHDDEDNIIAALEHPDRVRYLGLDLTGMQLEKMIPVMQDSFPVLISLDIYLNDGYSLVLPADYLGGSAPCLQEIKFSNFPYPALPTLLLSTTDLVTLHLYDIPPDGYISSEVMVASLVMLPRLKDLIIHFEFFFTQRDPTLPLPPPTTRAILPALTSFKFQGTGEYLEALVAPIDGPQLNWIHIEYLNDSVDLPVAEFSKFFDRSSIPGTVPTLAEVRFDRLTVTFDMYRNANHLRSDYHHPISHLACGDTRIHWQVPKMARMFSQFSAILSTITHLKLFAPSAEDRHFEATGAEWLHFLSQFSTVQALYISRAFAKHVALALENITGEVVAGAWPSLVLICLEDQPTSSVEKFIVARRVSGRPVTAIDTETEFDQQLMYYAGKS